VPKAKAALLDAEAAFDLRFIEQFLDWRYAAIARLFRARRRPDPLRDAILRRITILHCDGIAERVSYYQRQFRSLASKTAIQAELHELENYGVIYLKFPVPSQRRTVVCPTPLLIEWYQVYLSQLREIARAHILSRYSMSQSPDPGKTQKRQEQRDLI
jgi:hypothetical protein